jgi:hypothetical protein
VGACWVAAGYVGIAPQVDEFVREAQSQGCSWVAAPAPRALPLLGAVASKGSVITHTRQSPPHVLQHHPSTALSTALAAVDTTRSMCTAATALTILAGRCAWQGVSSLLHP